MIQTRRDRRPVPPPLPVPSAATHLLPLHVALVADEDALRRGPRVLGDVVHPVPHVVEGRLAGVGDVVHEHDAVRRLVVRLRDGVEARLPRRVPDLQLHLLAVHFQVLRLVIHARCRQQGGGKFVLRKAQHQRRLAHAAVAQQQQLDLHVVIFVVHRLARSHACNASR